MSRGGQIASLCVMTRPNWQQFDGPQAVSMDHKQYPWKTSSLRGPQAVCVHSKHGQSETRASRATVQEGLHQLGPQDEACQVTYVQSDITMGYKVPIARGPAVSGSSTDQELPVQMTYTVIVMTACVMTASISSRF